MSREESAISNPKKKTVLIKESQAKPGMGIPVDDVRDEIVIISDALWNRIFQTYAEDAQGEHVLVELQQNPETKDIRSVKVR